MSTISMSRWDFLEVITAEQTQMEEVQQLINKLEKGEASQLWTTKEGLPLHKHRIFMPKLSSLVDRIISSIHNSCHKGYLKILRRLTQDFFGQACAAVC